MNSKLKNSFFVKLKNAIFNFDEYPNFAEEKLGKSLKYIFTLMLLFSIIFSIMLTIRMANETKTLVKSFEKEFPEFKIENNTLTMENPTFEKTVENENLKIIVDAEKEEFSNEDNNYRTIAILKDKISLIANKETVSDISYKEILTKFNLETITKNDIINFINR